MERNSNTDMAGREEILAKAKQLAELIASSSEVQFYQRAEQQIHGSERVQSLISAIKKKQQEAVVSKAKNRDPETVRKIEGELSALQDELEQIPLVAEFRHSQSEINDVLQLVVKVIHDSVSDTIELEAGFCGEFRKL